MKTLTSLCVLCLICFCLLRSTVYSQTPIEKHGQLKVSGNHLVNANGQVVQLKGFGTHGLQWYRDFYKDGIALDSAAKDWGVQILRLTVYVYEDGYLDHPTIKPEDFDKMIFAMVDRCIANGVYCIIDWHIHHPGFPSYYLEDAKKFFDKMAKRYAGVPNVLYEIANEPNKTGYKEIEGHEVTWNEIKEYAHEVIPIIRKHSPNAIVLVGTPAWSSLGHSGDMSWQEIADSPLEIENLLYVIHFYAAGHDFEAKVDAAAKKLPLFATEWAAASWKNDSKNDFEAMDRWLKVIDRHKIGWTYWNFAPGNSVFNSFKHGTSPKLDDLKPTGPNITETGKLVYGLLHN